MPTACDADDPRERSGTREVRRERNHGYFTSRTAFTATVDADTSVEPDNAEMTVACSGPPLGLAMKWSGG
jgi:hypothetical protein